MKLCDPVDPQIILRSPKMLIAFGFGSGLSRIMPGTVGTAAAILPYLALAQLPPWLYFGVIVVASVWGIRLCGEAAERLGVHDHGGIVWDEFVGLWLTMFLVPLTPVNLLLGFIVFRFFDMVKPWPISLADKRVGGGWGIMLDDIIAGVISCLCLHIYLIV